MLVGRLMAGANLHAAGLLQGQPDKSSDACPAAIPVSVAFETRQVLILGGVSEHVRCSGPGAACALGAGRGDVHFCQKSIGRGWCATIGRIRDAKWCVDALTAETLQCLVRRILWPAAPCCRRCQEKDVRTDPFPLVQTPRDIQSAILGRRQMQRSTQPKLLGAPVSMCPANAALICPSDDTVRVLEGVTQEQMAA